MCRRYTRKLCHNCQRCPPVNAVRGQTHGQASGLPARATRSSVVRRHYPSAPRLRVGSSRGYSFMDGADLQTGQLDAGLFFICFQSDPRTGFIPVQRKLADDALNEYIRHTSSGLFACPRGLRTVSIGASHCSAMQRPQRSRLRFTLFHKLILDTLVLTRRQARQRVAADVYFGPRATLPRCGGGPALARRSASLPARAWCGGRTGCGLRNSDRCPVRARCFDKRSTSTGHRSGNRDALDH
jgi:hypothetical protein